MSVLARKRKLSELKFYDNAIRLRRSMIYLLLRDLGAKRGGAHQVGAVSAEALCGSITKSGNYQNTTTKSLFQRIISLF